MRDKIMGNVYMTHDYKSFKRLRDNRVVTRTRTLKLMASISNREIINPIIVNEKMEIIDGQGRYEALKELGKPIYYIVIPGLSSEDCRVLNKYNTKWSVKDIAESYASSGNENYIRLMEVKNNTKLSFENIMSAVHKSTNLSTTSNGKGELRKCAFDSGTLSFTEEDARCVYSYAELLNRLIDALQLTKRPARSFHVALAIMIGMDGFDAKRLVSQCKKNRSNFMIMSSVKDMLTEFERVYNKNFQSRIYFTDYYRSKDSRMITSVGIDDISSLNFVDDYED